MEDSNFTIVFQEKYKDSKYNNFPDFNIDPSTKDMKYCIKRAEAMYHKWLIDRTSILFSNVSEMLELRAYSNGRQNPNKYKNFYEDGGDIQLSSDNQTISYYDTKTSREDIRKGWGNIDFNNIYSYAPKIVRSLHGMLDDVDFDCIVRTIDERSGAKEESMAWGLYVENYFREWFQQVEAKLGIQSGEPQFVPDNIEEFELYKALGGFKLSYAIVMEELVKHGFDFSEYTEIVQQFVQDLIDWNVICAYVDYDKKTSKHVIKHIPAYLTIIQHSDSMVHSDSEYAGHIEYVSISELSEYFDIEDLMKIAKSYCGIIANPDLKDVASIFQRNYYLQEDIELIKNFKVAVLVSEWIDLDTKNDIIYTTKIGGRKIIKYDIGWKNSGLKEREEQSQIAIRKKYGCKWIIGTEYGYECGVSRNQKRIGKNDLVLDHLVVKIPSESITKILKPHYDQTQLLYLKLQNGLSKANFAITSLNIDSLDNLTLGGKKMDAKQLFKLVRQTTFFPYKNTNLLGKVTNMTNEPIHMIDGGMGRMFNEIMQMMEINRNTIFDMVGLNPVALGSSPEEREAAKNVQAAMAGMQNVLKPFITGLMQMKKYLAKNYLESIRSCVNSGNEYAIKAYAKIVGEDNMELLRFAEGDGVMYGQEIEPRPTEQEKMSLLSKIQLALQSGQIDITDAIRLERQILNGGNLKKLGIEISHKIQKAKEQAQMQQQAAIQEQNKGLQQLEMIKQQNSERSKALEVQGQMTIDNNKSSNEEQLLITKYQLEAGGIVNNNIAGQNTVQQSKIPDNVNV